MTDHRNFTDLLLSRVEQDPGREALLLLPGSPDRGHATPVTYRDLDASVRRLAGWLQNQGAAGRRVLLLHRSRRQFTVSFLACLYAGAVAVPAPPGGGRSHHLERIAGIVKDTAPCVALTDAALVLDMSRLLADCGHGSMPCLPADAVPGAPVWSPPDLPPETTAYLQYTSGSTGQPRGVVVSHANLLATQQAIQEALGTEPCCRLGGWLPLHHDLGLVGQLLHPLWLGGTSVMLPAESFVRHPVRWLEAVGRHRISVSGAPDFAYDLCTRRVTDEQLAGLDLSGWRVAVSGGEPVRAETMAGFAERFAPAGFRAEAFAPCYGLAEATLLVSGGRGAAPPLPERAVDSGSLERHQWRDPVPGRPVRRVPTCGPAVGCEIRVVDPDTATPLPDGRIGEIWVRGPGVALGYWRNPGETARVFRVATADGEGGFLRTGDLGTLEDGRLHVTGRLKDMIVVAGRNLYPQDMERTVQQVSVLFGPGTAFAVPGERERVVMVQELRTRSSYDVDLAALAAQVERCLAEEFEVSVGGVLLVRPGTVRRTTSGKVERSAMRELFLRGRIRPLHQRLDRELLTGTDMARAG
ncbi:fatty acyl-AMP ligase [Streptomyces morookaense]|uniref:Fatty acyl-AMP ligase n=1 Tax=Streptomyces morookaense TaxID=1970 RepID=A0A7Y7B246_STRMO|nr:fatty acyl-AMP ligase [Streptomyces morookaense]NVK77485.1 fatty acyl-AMP ligase [Streptomyces morookaense]GHF22029.1 polyketide synthase [Streptomyces morookaense]